MKNIGFRDEECQLSQQTGSDFKMKNVGFRGERVPLCPLRVQYILPSLAEEKKMTSRRSLFGEYQSIDHLISKINNQAFRELLTTLST